MRNKLDQWSAPLAGKDLLKYLIRRERCVIRLQETIGQRLPAGDMASDTATALRRASDTLDDPGVCGVNLLLLAAGITSGSDEWTVAEVYAYLASGKTTLRPHYNEMILRITGQEIPREVSTDDELIRFLELYRAALMGPLTSLAEAAG